MVTTSNAEASVAKLRDHGCEVQFSNYEGAAFHAAVGLMHLDHFLINLAFDPCVVFVEHKLTFSQRLIWKFSRCAV